MGKNEKRMHFANFNITYGEDEQPMLEHFMDIIYPAFISGYKRGKSNERPSFYFSNIDIKMIDKEFVLVGNYIKDMEYDIHTKILDGKLVASPAQVPTAPYSRFIIFLKNHRMVLVRNEANSPDVRSFQATIRKMLNDFINQKNKVVNDINEKLPRAMVNIVDIPLDRDIEANDYLFQLDPLKFNTIPNYIIKKCDANLQTVLDND